MNLADEIRKQIEKNKALKLSVGEINNHLSILEGMLRADYQKQVDDAYQRGYDKGYADKTNNDKAGKELAKDIYQRGLSEGNDIGYKDGVKDGQNEAWEAAKKIALMDTETSENVTGYFGLFRIMDNLTASEAIAKLKAYEEKQKTDDKIEVGDEVNWIGDCFIVTRIFQPRNMKEQCDGIDDDGCVYHDVLMDDLEKTGRHFDIKSILEEMRHD